MSRSTGAGATTRTSAARLPRPPAPLKRNPSLSARVAALACEGLWLPRPDTIASGGPAGGLPCCRSPRSGPASASAWPAGMCHGDANRRTGYTERATQGRCWSITHRDGRGTAPRPSPFRQPSFLWRTFRRLRLRRADGRACSRSRVCCGTRPHLRQNSVSRVPARSRARATLASSAQRIRKRLAWPLRADRRGKERRGGPCIRRPPDPLRLPVERTVQA
jgi:hypothetical protein